MKYHSYKLTQEAIKSVLLGASFQSCAEVTLNRVT